jgi:hypothetical protein
VSRAIPEVGPVLATASQGQEPSWLAPAGLARHLGLDFDDVPFDRT